MENCYNEHFFRVITDLTEGAFPLIFLSKQLWTPLMVVVWRWLLLHCWVEPWGAPSGEEIQGGGDGAAQHQGRHLTPPGGWGRPGRAILQSWGIPNPCGELDRTQGGGGRFQHLRLEAGQGDQDWCRPLCLQGRERGWVWGGGQDQPGCTVWVTTYSFSHSHLIPSTSFYISQPRYVQSPILYSWQPELEEKKIRLKLLKIIFE